MAAWISVTPQLGLSYPGIVEAVQSATVGTIARFRTGPQGEGEFIYLSGAAGIDAGDVCEYQIDYSALNASSTVAPWAGTGNAPAPLCVATAATTANTWGWYQISGSVVVNCSGTIAEGDDLFWQAAGVVSSAPVAGAQMLNAVAASANGVPAADKVIVTVGRPFAQGIAGSSPAGIEYVRNVGTPAENTAAIQAAVERLKVLGGGVLWFPPGVYDISNFILFDADNLHAFVQAGATVRQMTYGLPVIQMDSADYCSVSGGGWMVNPVTKYIITGSYRGRPAHEHAAAVYVTGCNGVEVRDISFDNFFCDVYFLSEDWTTVLNENNRVSNIYTQYQDVGVLVICQRNLRIDGVTSIHTLFSQMLPDGSGPPPHLFYFAGTSLQLQSENVAVSNCVDYDNPWSSSFKFLNIKNLSLTNLASKSCVRGLDMATVDNVTVAGLSITDMYPNAGLAAGIDVEGPATNIEIVGPMIECRDDHEEANCILIRNNCTNVNIRGGTFSADRTGATSNPIITINGTDNSLIEPVIIERNDTLDKYPIILGTGFTGATATNCRIIRPTYRNVTGTRLVSLTAFATGTQIELDVSLLRQGYASNVISDLGTGTQIKFTGKLPTLNSGSMPTSAAYEGAFVLVGNSAVGRNPARSQNGIWYYPDGSTVVADIESLLWQAAVVAAGGTVSGGRLTVVQTFIAAEKASGAWYQTDDYWPLWGEGSVQALMSLKQRRLAAVTAAPAFTIDRGYVFNGTSNYIRSGFKPLTHAIAMSGDNLRIAVYERTSVAASVRAGAADSSTKSLTIIPHSATHDFLGACNANTTIVPGVAAILAMSAVSRAAGSTNLTAWNRGVSLGSATPPSSAAVLTNLELYFGCYNNAGTPGSFTACSLGMVAVGASLSVAQELAQYNAVQAWATSVGANV